MYRPSMVSLFQCNNLTRNATALISRLMENSTGGRLDEYEVRSRNLQPTSILSWDTVALIRLKSGYIYICIRKACSLAASDRRESMRNGETRLVKKKLQTLFHFVSKFINESFTGYDRRVLVSNYRKVG